MGLIDEVSAVAYINGSVDRGHMHSTDVSEMCIWISQGDVCSIDGAAPSGRRANHDQAGTDAAPTPRASRARRPAARKTGTTRERPARAAAGGST